MALSEILELEKEIGKAYDPKEGERAFASTLLGAITGEIDRRQKAKDLEAKQQFELEKAGQLITSREKIAEAKLSKAGTASEYAERRIYAFDTATTNTKLLPQTFWGKQDRTYNWDSSKGGDKADQEISNLAKAYATGAQEYRRLKKEVEDTPPEERESWRAQLDMADKYQSQMGGVIRETVLKKYGKNLTEYEIKQMTEMEYLPPGWFEKMFGAQGTIIDKKKAVVVPKGGAKKAADKANLPKQKGDIVVRGEKKYKVVGFAEDGEALVEEQR